MTNKEVLKNLHDIAITLKAYSEWFEKYREWYKARYGNNSEADGEASADSTDPGSLPPPPPPPVPPH